jgi:prolyl-tRNA editing enzyme YbaK/EbsC (Cys-tRNA(Pro) deacylase)
LSEELSSNARRVRDALQALGFIFKVAELPASTRTARDAARAIGCQVQNIAKSLIFRGKHTDSPILVIASGKNRVDEAKLSRLAGEPVEKADADFVRRHTGFPIGGVPPIGHIENLETFIDEDLFQHEVIWAAAGTPHAVFELKPDDLLKMANGKVVAVK